MCRDTSAHVESEFEKYRIVQDRLFENDFDKVIKQIELEVSRQIGMNKAFPIPEGSRPA